MRAVKTKLRKGNYVVMLTQFDSLGGMGPFSPCMYVCTYMIVCAGLPLSWTRIGISGIGESAQLSGAYAVYVRMYECMYVCALEWLHTSCKVPRWCL